MKRRSIYMLAVILVCTILVIAWVKFPFWNDEEEYYNMQEVVNEAGSDNRNYNNDSERPKTQEYKIKDKVLYTRNLTLPSFDMSQNQEGGYVVIFDKNKTIDLIGVGFKSLEGYSLFFYADTNISFKVGKTNRFTLKTHKYPDITTDSGFWSTIEPNFFSYLLVRYTNRLTSGDFEGFNVTVTKNYDNSTGRFNTTFRFGEPYDFFPNDVEWHVLDMETRLVSIEENAIYDDSEKFLGELVNNTLNRSIQKNDKLIIKGEVNEEIKNGSPTPNIGIKAKLYEIPKCENPTDFRGVYRIYFEE